MLILLAFFACGSDPEPDAPPAADVDTGLCDLDWGSECGLLGFDDGGDGSRPRPVYWACYGVCGRDYCDGYCAGEVAMFGEELECGRCR